MNKKFVAGLLCCSMLLLSGCSLAKEEAPRKEEDRLVGVYLTDVSPDRNDGHWVEYGTFTADTEYGALSLPNLILPAEYSTETGEYVFPGLEGYALFEATVQDADGTCTVAQSDLLDGDFHVTSTDFGDSFALSGTLYVGEEAEDTIWTANHVYQRADGLVYLDGSGSSYQGGVGEFSGTVEQTRTTAVNGEEGSVSTSVKFTVKTIARPERLLVYQYDAAGRQIAAEELAVNGEEQTVVWAPDAAWAVVEEQYADSVSRTAYNVPEDGEEEAVHTVVIPDGNGIGRPAAVRFRQP